MKMLILRKLSSEPNDEKCDATGLIVVQKPGK